MKQPVYILGFVILVFIVYIISALVLKPETQTLTCTLGVGTYSQTTVYEYTKDQIVHIEALGTVLEEEDLLTQETYIQSQYIGEDLFELFALFKADLESDGHICTIE